MAQVAAIILPDALATPVNHTFIPQGKDKNGVWWFEDQSKPQSLGWNKISLELVRNVSPAGAGSAAQSRTNRVKIGIHIPVLETLGVADGGIVPSATLAYTPRCNIEFILSERSVTAERKDLLKYTVGLLGNAQVVALAQDLQNIWG